MSAFWHEPIGAHSDLDNLPGTIERLDRFRVLAPHVEITSARYNGLGAWQAHWDTEGGSNTITRKMCAALLDELRAFFPEWEPALAEGRLPGQS